VSVDAPAIAAAVDGLFDAMAAALLDETLAFFTPADDAALYGSEVGEVIIGHDALRSFFQHLYVKGQGPRFVLRDRRLSIRGDIAWFVAEADVHLAGQIVPYRVSGVLERHEGRWLWALFNGSEPRPDRKQ